MRAFLVLGLVFSIPSQEIGLGNVSEMTYFMYRVGRKTTTQSISPQVSVVRQICHLILLAVISYLHI